MGVLASVFKMSFSILCFRFQIEVFSYCTLTETFAIGFQKGFDHEGIDFDVFCSKMASFVDFITLRTEICKNCWNVILFDNIEFFRCLLWGVIWSVLKKCLYPLIKVFFKFRLVSFSKAMQRYSLYFRLFHFLCFLASIGKTLWLLLKTK